MNHVGPQMGELMAASEEALRIKLTRGAIDNGYIRVPSDQQLFPNRFIAAPDGEPEQRFSLVLPDGKAFRTCVLGNIAGSNSDLRLHSKSSAYTPATSRFSIAIRAALIDIFSRSSVTRRATTRLLSR